MVERLFEEVPLWIVLILIFVGMGLAREVGAWSRRRLIRASEAGDPPADETVVLTAVLGLLALLMAFSFGMALNRHETRRELVVTEANALGTAYLRTSVLDDPGRLRALMRNYAQTRLTFGLNGGETQRAADRETARQQPPIWDEAVRLVGPSRTTPLAGFVLAPLNDAFDAASARKAALAARLPPSVLLTLSLYLIASAVVLGYGICGAGLRHRAASLALLALFALAFSVILDLDRPRSGLIRVPQGTMADTLQMMGG
ncbi:hypothetical protein LJR225_003232 [Phenylobacterium sp. LjRoot225]|uniref:bestrophin-like domain n=1 Tax=Phenylobacterium sp. LjRoot225 TaxID=3342285 RepID=UPI003ECFC1B9